jgi:hypothetical protein
MTLAAERELAHMGETAGCSDHDHDLAPYPDLPATGAPTTGGAA